MIDAENILNRFVPTSDQKKNKALYKASVAMLKKLLHQDEINHFIDSHRHLEGFEFNDTVLDHFDFSFSVSNRDRARLPAQGSVLIVANHPIGSLDGLALLKLVSEIRSDVKVVANQLLSEIRPLKNLFIALDNMSSKANHRNSFIEIKAALEAEQAVIMFPTGEVSRIRPTGVRDGKWKTGFLNLAKTTESPIVPVNIMAKNSALFYVLSTLFKPLGTMMLVNEMFNKQDQDIFFRIGNPIPWESIAVLKLNKKAIANRMRKQVYLLPKNKKVTLFDTIETIVHPPTSGLIRKELQESPLIGATKDGQQIYLFDYRPNSSVIRELGRLREISFRTVREGTGHAIDLDDYDRTYRHLILWNDHTLEIVGAYRIGDASTIVKNQGIAGLYSSTLFEYDDTILPYLEHAIELGRSFIQPKYWGKHSLDYLWYGIGAYLKQHPNIRYMIGPVSISASYPEQAKQLISRFYGQLFASEKLFAKAKSPYRIKHSYAFDGYFPLKTKDDYKHAFAELKSKLDNLGVKVPALYKQYVELCHLGGCQFIDFNVDNSFSDCVDALILVDIDKVKQKKKDRYINSH